MDSRLVEAVAVSAESAQELIRAAVDQARESGIAISVAILDPSGHLKAFHKMDGATLRSSEVSQTKAYSAVSFGVSTHLWYDIAKGDGEIMNGLPYLDRFTMLGGGHPLLVGGALVGSIGVSGGPTAEADIACARAAMASVGFDADS